MLGLNTIIAAHVNLKFRCLKTLIWFDELAYIIPGDHKSNQDTKKCTTLW